MNLFLTGTDTDAGKTFVAALLIRSLRAAGLDTAGMKPLCCGGRTDAELLCEACGGTVEINTVNPVWLRTPASPYTAALIENRAIDLDLVREKFRSLRRAHRSLIVEGAGGWLTPVTRDFSMADLAAEFALPVAVVVRNRLGAINHTLLTVADIRARGLACAGIILNTFDAPDMATATNGAVLESLLDVPILFEVEKGQSELRLGVA